MLLQQVSEESQFPSVLVMVMSRIISHLYAALNNALTKFLRTGKCGNVGKWANIRLLELEEHCHTHFRFDSNMNVYAFTTE